MSQNSRIIKYYLLVTCLVVLSLYSAFRVLKGGIPVSTTIAYHLLAALAALIASLRRDRGSWYVVFFGGIQLPIAYLITFHRGLFLMVKSQGSIWQFFSMNIGLVFYTIIGIAFIIYLFNRTILGIFGLERAQPLIVGAIIGASFLLAPLLYLLNSFV